VPKYYIKGPDYFFTRLPEQETCDELGVSILYRPGPYTYSSSAVVEDRNSFELSGVFR
jgi:hypothetical protein